MASFLDSLTSLLSPRQHTAPISPTSPIDAMARNFGSLPTEITFQIIQNLDLQDRMSLSRCNKRLHSCVETELYRKRLYRDMAMCFALKHLHIDLLKRLLDIYKASPTAVYITHGSLSLTCLPRFVDRNGEEYAYAVARRVNEDLDLLGQASLTIPAGFSVYCLGDLTLGILAKINTASLDAAKTADYFEAWQVLLDRGARLNASLVGPIAFKRVGSRPFVPYKLKEPKRSHFAMLYFRDIARKLLRRLVTKPAATPAQADIKVRLIRIYYDALRDMAVADVGMSPASVFLELPRLIRHEYDDVVIGEILDHEDELLQLQSPSQSPPMPRRQEFDSSHVWRKWSSIPLVDRPVKSGRSGELLSPLSAAIFNNNRRVFDLLIKRGAQINGVTIDHLRHGPKKYASHIPIFAAARMAATNPTAGMDWIDACIRAGAKHNRLALGRLDGSYRPPPEKNRMPVLVGGYCFWISPLDVYLSSLPTSLLQRTATPTHGLLDLAPVKNLAQFLLRGFTANLAVWQRLSTQLALPPLNEGQDPVRIQHACGTNGGRQKCQYHGLRLCRSPASVEILINRFPLDQARQCIGYFLARYLVENSCTSEDCLTSLFLQCEARAKRPGRFSAISNAVTAEILWTVLEKTRWTARETSGQVGVYLIYRELHCWGHVAIAKSILDRYKLKATTTRYGIEPKHEHASPSGAAHALDFNPLFCPDNIVFKDYRLRVCGLAPDLFNSHPVHGSTVLHELCRLWNIQQKQTAGGVPRQHYSDRLELLVYLISNGVDIYVVDGHGNTPMDLLVMDDEHTLTAISMALLQRQADFMEATWACHNPGSIPHRAMHRDFRGLVITTRIAVQYWP